MVTIQGLGGLPEPKSERVAKTRNDRDAVSSASTKATAESGMATNDAVKISSEAQAAAEITRILQTSKMQTEIRMDRVSGARERMQSGDYKNPEVVAEVAQRLVKFLA